MCWGWADGGCRSCARVHAERVKKGRITSTLAFTRALVAAVICLHVACASSHVIINTRRITILHSRSTGCFASSQV